MKFPRGFRADVGNIGIKDEFDDVLILAADRVVPTAGLYTLSRFAGPSVVVSRQHGGDGHAMAWVAVARNANVATGTEGLVIGLIIFVILIAVQFLVITKGATRVAGPPS